jgi:hypothetical protein
MTFEYKKVTDEVAEKLIGKVKGEVVQHQSSFAIDQARHISFLSLGETSLAREYEEIAYFNLIFDTGTVTIEGKFEFVQTSGGAVRVLNISRIGIPKVLNLEPEEVLQIFEEGANAYYNGMSKYKRTVKTKLCGAVDWT